MGVWAVTQDSISKYNKSIREEWHRFKDGEIKREEADSRIAEHWDVYLTDKHLEDGDLSIFKKLLHEAKNKYGKAKDNYYLGRINITKYIWERGLAVGKGIGWYDYRAVQLGLATELLPTKHREDFSWKSLKVEREIMPDSLIEPGNIDKCPVENEIAAAETLRVYFELIDFYNKNYVPTLRSNWDIRDEAWIEIEKEREAYDKPYLDVTVTPRERLQFERWRDGITTGLGTTHNPR